MKSLFEFAVGYDGELLTEEQVRHCLFQLRDDAKRVSLQLTGLAPNPTQVNSGFWLFTKSNRDTISGASLLSLAKALKTYSGGEFHFENMEQNPMVLTVDNNVWTITGGEEMTGKDLPSLIKSLVGLVANTAKI